ncbi:MAG: uroporphyrinogen-III synthase [Sphingomonadales bacterium]|jgi:uroporphyrinogen-III synthase|nr:uroporphyrinogen-III synthase [Sphingomonadales bacterium]
MKVLILRPQPGADESAERARAIGLEPIVAPLFTLRALAWRPPDPARFDAILLTSANAARLGGDGLTPFLALPCYAVGERTAEAARAAGFGDVRIGPSDGAALLALAGAHGAGSLLHLGGREHIVLDRVTHISVYAAEAAGALPADAGDALVLLHSPRAAAGFAALVGRRRGAIRIAAISAQTAAAAGEGWKSIAIADAPRDQALLELAAKLCQTEPR